MLPTTAEATASAVNQLLEGPTFWSVVLVVVAAAYFWRRDLANPEKNASNAVLTGAAATSAEVYEMAREALRETRHTQKRFNALLEYTRVLQRSLIAQDIPVPPMPDAVLE